ncbi:paternally-expressed gene 3 protein isoform X2 [Kogia breviceps]
MYEPEDDSSSDAHGEGSMSRKAAESPPPHAACCSDRDWDQDWDRDWEPAREREHRRGRSRDREFRARWPYARSPSSRFHQRDLSLPLMEKVAFAKEREHKRRDSVMDYETRSQDAVSYQDVVALTEDRKPQNPVQDNMENYRKLLSLGVQLAEDDGHSHMTQGHSSRSKRSAYPSTSRGLKSMPETKKSAHRRGICEDESSHGVIMEKFIKDVSRNSRSGRAREPGDRLQRFPRRPDSDWKEVPFNKRESVIQERGHEGNAFGGGGFNLNSNLVSRKRVVERKRRYHFDTDGKGSVHGRRGGARKRPFERSEVRKAASGSGLSAPPVPQSQPFDFGATPYVCDECGRSFSVISGFVEHQITHTRENLYEYGESFLHSVAVSEVQKRQAGGKRFECKECGESFNKSAALAEHRKMHARDCLAGRKAEESEEHFMPSPTFRELQKIYGKDKFYECRVCKETFLHSSALIEHQKTHGRDDKGNERGGAFKPSPVPNELQKMYGKEKMYECKVCGETFHHSASLKEHHRIHTRGNPFENKGKVCEETFIPGQSLKRRQKTYPTEKAYDFKDGGDAFRQNSDLIEHQRVHSRKNLFEGRGYEKPVIHSVSFPESQKSHTITRPPEDEDDEKAFTVSSSPDDSREAPSYERNPYERSFIHSSAFSGAQKSHGKPRVIAEATIRSSGATEHQKAHAGESTSERKGYERSVIHSLAAFKPPRGRGGSELLGCDEQRECSAFLAGPCGQPQETPARESPWAGAPNSVFKGSVGHGASHGAVHDSLAGEGPSGWKQDGGPPAPRPAVREHHQKARAKKKNIERRIHEASVIRALRCGEPQMRRPREKFHGCPQCAESFGRSSDLTEHQQIHDRKRLCGGENYMRSVIRSSAATEPQSGYAGQSVHTAYAGPPAQTSYAEAPAQTSYSEPPAQTSYAEPPAQTSYAEPPAQTSYAEPPAQTSYAEPPAQTSYAEAPAQTSYAEAPAQTSYAEAPAQTSYAEPPAQTSYAEPPAQTSYSEPPAQTSYSEPPAQTSYAEPPAQTSYSEPPAQTSYSEPPAQTSYSEPPAQTSYAEAPAQTSYAEAPAQTSCPEPPAQTSYAEAPAQTSYAEAPAQASYAAAPAQTSCPEAPAQTSCPEAPAQTSYAEAPAQASYAAAPAQTSCPEAPAQTSYAAAPAQTGCPEAPAQTSYAEQPVRNECKDCGECFATVEELGIHQKIYAREKFHGGELFGDSVIQGVGLDGLRQEGPDEPDEAEDTIYGCKDCGLGFADRTDLKDHQKVHGREYLVDSREDARSVTRPRSVSEDQRDHIGEQLYECPACGESFVHSSFLFEHQKIHEQDQVYGPRRYDEPFMQPLVISPQRPRAPQKSPPAGTSLQCQVCGRDFIHGSVLNEHMRVHAGDSLLEQGQGSTDAVSPGSAPTDLQRDQAKDKHHECKTCGESFLSQADLREHVRIHEKDEPYDYGATFVHTSFLTEPPKRDSPFYECKDCGKSFIHNTVLTKHQKLHLEEEEAAAAAQEVEANVLVPREVLRIQGSNVEAAEPEVEAAEPEVEAAEPNVEAAEPNGEAEGPEGEAAEPNGEAGQPNGEAEQPNGDADEPDGAGIEDPEERAEEPEGDADEPDGAGIEDPEEEGDGQEIQVEEPYYDCRECGETFTSNSAYGEHLKTHARVIIFEPGSVYGESSHYTEHASTSSSDSGRADDKYFKCDVCGQVFTDRLSLARHQNTHTG